MYRIAAAEGNYQFILNFPSIELSDENGIKVKTITELYSSAKNKIVYKNELVGKMNDMPGDYPMCIPGSLECAFVSSCYESVFACLQEIADSRKK